MKDIEKQAADDNTVLQLQGAHEQVRKACAALENALVLGGNVSVRQHQLVGLSADVHRLRRLLVVNAYRQKYNFADIKRLVRADNEQEVLTILMEHFQHDKKLAYDWMTAEQSVQGAYEPNRS